MVRVMCWKGVDEITKATQVRRRAMEESMSVVAAIAEEDAPSLGVQSIEEVEEDPRNCSCSERENGLPYIQVIV